MSLLIKGVGMSDSCSKCPIKYSSYDMYCCRMICGDGCIVCVDSYTERRNPACPFVEIPTPHGRLIDADEIRTSIESMKAIESAMPVHTQQQIFDLIINLISNAAAVIEAEE